MNNNSTVQLDTDLTLKLAAEIYVENMEGLIFQYGLLADDFSPVNPHCPDESPIVEAINYEN